MLRKSGRQHQELDTTKHLTTHTRRALPRALFDSSNLASDQSPLTESNRRPSPYHPQFCKFIARWRVAGQQHPTAKLLP
jgi:hypothetical protein